MSKILVPVDGSEGSVRAAEFAGRLPGAEVTLLYVYDAPAAVAMGLVALSREQLQKGDHGASRTAFQRATEALGRDPSAALSELGHPIEVILSVARSGPFDHIVMGSRGLSPMRELLLGSVSHGVLQRAPCPVTIVR